MLSYFLSKNCRCSAVKNTCRYVCDASFSWYFFIYIVAKIVNRFLFMYRETRAAVLEQSLRKLGVEKLGKEDVQRMQWEVLEAKIGHWIQFMRIAVRSCIDLYELLGIHYSNISM